MSKQEDHDDLLSRLEKGNESFLDNRARQGMGCPKCNWRTYTIDENNKATNCECWLKRSMSARYKEANIPPFYLNMNLEDDWHLKQDANNKDAVVDYERKLKIKKCISQYIKNIVPMCAGLKLRFPDGTAFQNLLLVGEHGSGKTMLSAIIAKEAINKGLITQFIDWIDLEPVFSDFDSREEQNRIIESCKAADLVVIDGVQNLGVNNPYYLSGLERIAAARVNKGQPTVISAFENYVDVRSRHNWASLIDSCHILHLPSPRKADTITVSSPSNNIKRGNYRPNTRFVQPTEDTDKE